MACIEKFLGKRVEMPEDRRYWKAPGLWAKADGREILLGFSEPALILCGGFNGLESLVPDGEKVQKGQAVAFAITGKILYIEAPFDGSIRFNPDLIKSPASVLEDPYGAGWLFGLEPAEGVESVMEAFAEAEDYAESLKSSEGCKNPDGLKGGVSGICKAVYSGIREQEIR
ncbi:MAG: hypothetical protein GY859_06765 [Desulfobacterales bacterium]|nr:hypothetical protein [Desulfobacterales bacterium]